jgi:hypothetical protein
MLLYAAFWTNEKPNVIAFLDVVMPVITSIFFKDGEQIS